MVSSNNVTITEYGLSLLVRGLRVFVLHPSEVAALRAHFAAERMPEDVQTLVDEANAWRNEDPATEVVSARVASLVGRLTDALEAAYSRKGAGDDPR